MARTGWTLLFLGLGFVLIGLTVRSHDWVVDAHHQDYRWGPAAEELCGDQPCYARGMSEGNDEAWKSFSVLGPLLLYASVGILITGSLVFVQFLRSARGTRARPRVLVVLTTVLLVIGLALALAFVAHRPVDGRLGWPYPAYLLGVALTLMGFASGSPARSVEREGSDTGA